MNTDPIYSTGEKVLRASIFAKWGRYSVHGFAMTDAGPRRIIYKDYPKSMLPEAVVAARHFSSCGDLPCCPGSASDKDFWDIHSQDVLFWRNCLNSIADYRSQTQTHLLACNALGDCGRFSTLTGLPADWAPLCTPTDTAPAEKLVERAREILDCHGDPATITALVLQKLGIKGPADRTDLAEKLGVTERTIYRWASGEIPPATSQIANLLEALLKKEL